MSQHRGNSLQNPGNPGMDPEFLAARKTMCEKIFTYLQRRNHSLSGDQQRRLPKLAKRMEDFIYKENTTKEEYLKMLVGPIEQCLQSIIRSPQHNSQHSSANVSLGSSGTNIASSVASMGSLGSSGTNIASSVASMGMSSQQYSQMIPTPGFNNQGTISMNSEYSNGGDADGEVSDSI